MGRDRTMSLQLQHDAGLILSNLQVLGQFVTSHNRMSSEVMRVAFTHELFPTEAVQFVAPSHRVRRAAIHGGHGTVASSMYSGDTWASTVIVMQRVHDVFGLLPRPSEVVKDRNLVQCFPLGGRTGVCGTLGCVY